MGEWGSGGVSDTAKAVSSGGDPGQLESSFRERGKRRGCSPASAARHRSRTRAPTDLESIFFVCFPRSDVSSTRNLKSDIVVLGEMYEHSPVRRAGDRCSHQLEKVGGSGELRELAT